MKKLLLFPVFLFLTMSINAQVTWPTFSVTPPTSGCNGVWKIDCSSTGGACGMTPYTYTFSPMGCATTSGLYFNLDTLSIPLCAVPCDMALDNASGQTCLAMTGSSTGIDGSAGNGTKIFPTQMKQGDFFSLTFASVLERMIQIFDESGRLVETISTEDGQLKISTTKWARGMYFISITSSNVGAELNKILIQ